MTSKTKVLSYTWYPKDWQSSDIVYQIGPVERCTYRELIDLAMEMNNRIENKTFLWWRKWNFDDENQLKNSIQKLIDLGAVEKNGDVFSVPSCNKRIENRCKNVANGMKGGRPKNQKVTIEKNENNNPTETQTITQPKPNRNPNHNPNHNPNTIQYNTIEEKEKEKKENLSLPDAQKTEEKPKPAIIAFNSFIDYFNSLPDDVKKTMNETSQFFGINAKDNARKMIDFRNFFDHLIENDQIKYYANQLHNYKKCIKLGHLVCKPDTWFGQHPHYDGKWNERGYQALYDHMMTQDTPQTRKARENEFWDGMGEGGAK